MPSEMGVRTHLLDPPSPQGRCIMKDATTFFPFFLTSEAGKTMPPLHKSGFLKITLKIEIIQQNGINII